MEVPTAAYNSDPWPKSKGQDLPLPLSLGNSSNTFCPTEQQTATKKRERNLNGDWLKTCTTGFAGPPPEPFLKVNHHLF